MTVTLTLPNARYKDPAQRIAFFRAVQARLAGLRGVETATLGGPLPFSGSGGWSGSFLIEGRETPPGDPAPHGDIQYVAPGYFEAMRIPLKNGRFFSALDREDTEPVFVIDENLARQYWPNENPVGKHMRQFTTGKWSTIVGVAGHVNHSDLAGDTGKGMYYYCLFQTPIPNTSIVVRTSAEAASLGPAIREAVRSVDSSQAVHDLKTLQDIVDNSLASRRFVVRLLGFFAAAALFLAALGLYGVISYSVTQRTQEIGVRMALGAGRSSLLGMVVGQGLRLAAIGMAAGLLLTAMLGRMLESQFYGTSPFDPLTLASISIVLLGAATLASYLPARRATLVDPLRALRYE